MPRETWDDLLAYFKNYISNMLPVMDQTRRFMLDSDPEILMEAEYLNGELIKEEKRSVHKAKAISEFLAMFRREVFGMIWSYIEESKEVLEPIDIKDYTIDFLDEAINALRIMENLTNPDQKNLEKTLLYQVSHFIQEQIFPQGRTLKEIYDKLVDKSTEYYEVQRHILKPSTYYREDLEENEVPGFTPNTYKIINEITSLFNLDPNFLEMPRNEDIEIPVIMKDEVFDPFIDQIASKEEAAINRILRRMELNLMDGIFIGPTAKFIELTEDHNYVIRKNLTDDKVRIMPQFSNETLVLLYLAKASYRRGFLSKELINWISSNIGFLIYNSILKAKVSDDNIFYPIFTDLKTEEKVLPYLMKLSCFENYLRMDRTKIRDSVQYRKEIFNSLGSKIESIDKLTQDIAEYIQKITEEEN